VNDNLELLHDRYARALFERAEESASTDKVMEELEILSEECAENKNFVCFLTHALITAPEKKKVVEEIARRNKYDRTILDFLKVLIDNKRENLIHAIFLRYRDLYDQHKKRIRVYIETAKLLTKDEKHSIMDTLALKFREKVDVEVMENPELIGGMTVQYKDKIYDYSVKTQLHRLKEKMVA